MTAYPGMICTLAGRMFCIIPVTVLQWSFDVASSETSVMKCPLCLQTPIYSIKTEISKLLLHSKCLNYNIYGFFVRSGSI